MIYLSLIITGGSDHTLTYVKIAQIDWKLEFNSTPLVRN